MNKFERITEDAIERWNDDESLRDEYNSLEHYIECVTQNLIDDAVGFE